MQEAVKKPLKNLINQKFGKLTVLSFDGYRGKYPYWHCRCECGESKSVYEYNLLSGSITSCGCVKKANGKEYAKQNLHVYQGVQIEKAMAKTTPKNNTTGFRGVYKDKKSGKYRARIILQGKRTELGYFANFADAVEERIKAEQKLDQIVAEYKAKAKSET